VKTNLNTRMEPDHVIRVHADGRVTSAEAGVYAPDLIMETDADGQILAEHETACAQEASIQGWNLMYGYSGRYGGSHSFIMHPSEFVGGHMARDILDSPGLYVTIEIYTDDGDSAGWAVARQLDEETDL